MEIKILKGQIKLLSNLHIGKGAGDYSAIGEEVEIIKDINDIPYIPGSSFKGKLRHLLNLNEYSKLDLLNTIFGMGKDKDNKRQTIALFRDITLSSNNSTISYLETKTENTPSQFSGLRTLEIVPKDNIFDFEIVLRLEKEDNEEEIIDFLKKGFKYLELDYLGGNGSRGYGQVEIKVLEIKSPKI